MGEGGTGIVGLGNTVGCGERDQRLGEISAIGKERHAGKAGWLLGLFIRGACEDRVRRGHLANMYSGRYERQTCILPQ